MEAQVYFEKFLDFAWNYGPKIISAIFLLLAGLWVIRRLSFGFKEFLRARKIDDSLRPFFASLVDVALKVALLLVVAGQLGIETTSFIAIFSAIAFAVGLALQGSLGNFASGVLILLFRPYKVGDLITAVGYTGHVLEIQIFNTILLTQNGVRIIIPNGKLTEGPIENIADKNEVMVEASLLVAAGASLDLLREIMGAVVADCPWALTERQGEVKVSGLSRDDIKVQFGCWTTGEHYEDTMHYLYEALKNQFAAHGIELAKERRRENM